MQTLGFDVKVWLTGMRGQLLLQLGRSAEARPLFDALIADPSPKVDALHKILAHSGHLDIALLSDAPADAADHAKRLAEWAERAGNPYLLSYGMFYNAIAAALSGDLDGAERQMIEALSFIRSRRAGLENEPRLLAELANIRRKRGDFAGALRTAREAVELARTRNTRLWLAYGLAIAQACDEKKTAPEELAPLYAVIGTDPFGRLVAR